MISEPVAHKSRFNKRLRQKAFVDAFCGVAHFNGSEAARLAGFKGNAKQLAVRGSEMLARGEVQQLIRERLLAANADRVADAREALILLTQHLRGSMDDFISLDANGRAFIDLAKAKKMKRIGLVRRLRVSLTRDEQRNVANEEITIELYDSQAAADRILRLRDFTAGESSFIPPMETESIMDLARGYIKRWLALGNSPDKLPPALREIYRQEGGSRQA